MRPPLQAEDQARRVLDNQAWTSAVDSREELVKRETTEGPQGGARVGECNRNTPR